MTGSLVDLRRSVLVALLFVLIACLDGCSSGPNSPSNVAATPPALPLTLKLVVAVSNTHLGNALPADFKISVAYDGPADTTTTVEGTTAGADLPMPRGANYSVSVAPLEGYTIQLSAACSGHSASEDATCEIAASDIDVTCDRALWDPVYRKDRLRVLSACEVATGIVKGTEIERDGDLEIWMAPDPKYSFLMKPGNQHSRGWLVVEVPCQAPIVQDDAMGACDGFTGPKVRVPDVSSHIVVAAPWVEDRSHHMWAELHGARVIRLPR
jgi:hypothetical protein